MLKKKTALYLACLVGGALGCFSTPLEAASINVSPVHVYLSADKKMTSFSLTNNAKTPLTVQVHVVKWTYKDGKDVETKTKDILLMPPSVRIGPKETQTLRIGLLKPLDPKTGTTYRIIIEEVPEGATAFRIGVSTKLKIVVPLFADPTSPTPPEGIVSAARLGKQQIRIQLVNKGLSHVSLNKITLKNAEDTLVEKDLYEYIIPNQSKTWDLEVPEAFSGKTVDVTIQTPNGNISSNAPLTSS